MKKRIISIIALIAIITAVYPAQLGFSSNETGPWGSPIRHAVSGSLK